MATARENGDSVETNQADSLADRLKLNGEFKNNGHPQPYCIQRMKAGFALMFVAGTISGLLGIGSGSLKVIAMDRAMMHPFKVSAASSNFMIGVTAATSASLYLSKGYVNPAIAMPVMLGVLVGWLVQRSCRSCR